MSLISTPLFKTNGTEELEVKDVYAITNSLPVNKLFEAAKDAGKNIFDKLTSKEGLLSGINTLISMKKNGGLNGADILNKGLSLLGTSKVSLLKDVGGAALATAGELAGANHETMAKVNVSVNGAVRSIDGDNSQKISGLLNVIGSLGGVSDSTVRAVNVGVESSMWGGVISEVVKNGIPDVLPVIKSVTDTEVYKTALAWASPSVATKGDTSAFNSVIGEIGGEKILANMPQFVPTFVGNLTFDPTTTKADLPALASTTYANLLATDSSAIKSTREGSIGDIFNLTTFSKMSDGAKELFSNVPDVNLKNVIQVASNFPASTNVTDAIKKYYPQSVAAIA